jgi:cyclic beta-1,2-glucan synthetase
VAALVPPRRLPRLELAEGVPESARTMVVVPTLFTSVAEVERLLEHLEVQALGNLDPRIHFALLSDFPTRRRRPCRGRRDPRRGRRGHRGAQPPARARAGRTASSSSTAAAVEPGRGVWMGWERKRGKLEEFNRLLRGATDTGFRVQVGDVSILPSVRYCLTLDSDTRLPRDAAKDN